MLEVDHQAETLEQALARLECRVQLPVDWKGEPNHAGPLPAGFEDTRRFIRFSYQTKAVLECRQSLIAIARQPGLHVVITKDVSRDGIVLLHAEQLFPRERVCLWLPGDSKKNIEVVSCRKLQPCCYKIGARFV